MRERLGSIIFGTRGLYLLVALAVSIVFKDQSQRMTPAILFFAGAGIALLAECFRMYCASYLRGSQAVTRVGADFLCTCGPYAYTRNPLYLANLILSIGLSLAINEWYAYLVLASSWVFVYAIVIPYEEKFLRQRFGDAFDEYVVHTGRLMPRLRPFTEGIPVVPDYRAGIVGELYAPFVVLGLFALLYVLFVK